MIKVGNKVRYVGEDRVLYQKGKLYDVVDKDVKSGLYSVMSELGEAYFLNKTDIEEVVDNG